MLQGRLSKLAKRNALCTATPFWRSRRVSPFSCNIESCINSKSDSPFNHYDHSLPARFLNITSTAVYLYRGQLLVVLVACDRHLGNASVKATAARDGAMLPIDGGGSASSLPSIPHAGRPSRKPRDSSARRPPPPPPVVLSLVRSTRRAPRTLRGSRRRRRRASRRPRCSSSARAYARGAALCSKETGARTGPSRRLGRSPPDMRRTSAHRGARTLRRVQLRTRSRSSTHSGACVRPYGCAHAQRRAPRASAAAEPWEEANSVAKEIWIPAPNTIFLMLSFSVLIS